MSLQVRVFYLILDAAYFMIHLCFFNAKMISFISLTRVYLLHFTHETMYKKRRFSSLTTPHFR